MGKNKLIDFSPFNAIRYHIIHNLFTIYYWRKVLCLYFSSQAEYTDLHGL